MEPKQLYQLNRSENITVTLKDKVDSHSMNLHRASYHIIENGKGLKLSGPSGPGVHLDIDIVSKHGNTLVSVKPNDKLEGVTRTPSTVCCVIDISGSMTNEAKIQTQGGGNEGFGLSILDLVKHAVRTIISSLGDNDRLALVAFCSEARVALDLTTMDEAGKKMAEEVLEMMQPEDFTNLWEGLYEGLEVLRKGSNGKNSAIFLLTDGQPNVIPPRGHLPMLQKYKDEHGLPNVINTLGFGYDLDSKLLYDLAVMGNGAYAFIPDGSLVGTIFVNALSNLLATVATDVCLSIELDQSQNIDFSLIKHYSHQVTAWGLEIQLGSVMFGQAKNFVIPINIDDPSLKLNVTLKYNRPYESSPVKVTRAIQVRQNDDPEINIHRFRLMFVNEVTKAQELTAKGSYSALTAVKNLVKEIQKSNIANIKFMKDLIQDIEGQTLMALSKQEYFQRWGKHFLPSLVRAHLLQQCNNFKDPGVQNYGGEIFNSIRDKIDTIFIQIPPPKPSIPGSQTIGNMSFFYSIHGGCIAGDCTVKMADGKTKLIKDIRKDDEVLGVNGESVKVLCVVKTICEKSRAQLVEFQSGLKITPWHPIKLRGKFYFPCTVSEPFNYEYFDCPSVYNFVLESHHLMIVNGIECVTLGHGFQEDVVRHEYYGTSAVVEDLKRIEGWDYGLVLLSSGDVRRDVNTGMVAGIIKRNEQSRMSLGYQLTAA